MTKQTPADIEKEFNRLAIEFNNARGSACYEIAQKMYPLMNRYYVLTGIWLQKPKRIKEPAQ